MAGLALLASTSATASAQPRAGVDRLDPAPAGEPFATVASPAVDGRLRLAAGVLVSYANRPLVLRTEGPGAASLDWVGQQATLHALASVELARRVKLEVDVPFVLAEGGDSGAIANGTYAAPSGAHLGDVRVGGRVLVLRQAGLLPAAAVGFTGWIPTGDPGSFSGAVGPSFGPSVLVGAGFDHFLWSATLAERFQARADENLVGSQTVLGVAAAARFAGFSLGPEARLAFANGAGPRLEGSSASVGAEILGVARYAIGPVALSAGGGGSIGSELGAPRYRLFASLAVAHELLSGPACACPFAPAGARGGGVAPAPEAASRGAAATTPVAPVGAAAAPKPSAAPLPPPAPPPDRDGDGVADRDDRCPDEPGAPSLDATRDGCPPDADGDGIVDAKDACPRERGAATADPKTNGCPAAVRVEGQQIVILQQVNFETGRDVVAASSFDLLSQIAAVMSEHPDLARVAVDGHTDGVGVEKQNLALSQRRAVAVVRWLVDHGVDARRLEARGFGPRRPLADNKTEAGRAKNRRVELQSRRRTPEGAAGWRDGPVD